MVRVGYNENRADETSTCEHSFLPLQSSLDERSSPLKLSIKQRERTDGAIAHKQEQRPGEQKESTTQTGGHKTMSQHTSRKQTNTRVAPKTNKQIAKQEQGVGIRKQHRSRATIERTEQSYAGLQALTLCREIGKIAQLKQSQFQVLHFE